MVRRLLSKLQSGGRQVSAQQQLEEALCAPVPALVPPVLCSTLQVFVSLPTLRLVVVNNSVGVPLATAALLGADVRLHQDTHGLHAAANTTLRAGKHNMWTRVCRKGLDGRVTVRCLYVLCVMCVVQATSTTARTSGSRCWRRWL